MGGTRKSDEAYNDEEAAGRRDALAKHMLSMPPRPLKPKAAAKPEKPKRKRVWRANEGKRGPSA
jgi:hypothetical protein